MSFLASICLRHCAYASPRPKEEEAEVARKFLDHKLPQVRKWASYEIEAATRDAEQHRAIFDQQRK